MKSGKILLGIIAGAAAGATMGILMAPDKGSSTRKKISQKGNQYVDELGGKLSGFVDTVTRKAEKVKDEASRQIDNGKQKAEEIHNKMAATANRDSYSVK